MHNLHVSVFLALSLDGYIAAPGHDLSWLSAYSNDSPEATGYSELMRSIDVMVMGRNTYDAVQGFEPWPYAGKKVVVLTRRALSNPHSVEQHNGPLAQLLPTLAAQGHRHVYLDGGMVVREGLQAGVVNTLTLSWVPVVLGSGIPLFGPGLPLSQWKPIQTLALPSGLMQVRYQRATVMPLV